MLASPAWLASSLAARCALVELTRLYNGRNNGQLALSARGLAERLGTSKDTAARALNELESRGFIETVKAGSFRPRLRRATEYRLTTHRCDVTLQPPSRAFMKWRPSYQSPPKTHPEAKSHPEDSPVRN